VHHVVTQDAADQPINAGGEGGCDQAAECDHREIGQQFAAHPYRTGASPRPEPVDEKIGYRPGQEGHCPRRRDADLDNAEEQHKCQLTACRRNDRARSEPSEHTYQPDLAEPPQHPVILADTPRAGGCRLR